MYVCMYVSILRMSVCYPYFVCICLCVFMYIIQYVIYVCMYVCMYVCYVLGEDGISREPYEEVVVDVDPDLQGLVIESMVSRCMYVCMKACMYECRHVCTVCMYVCM